MLIEKFDIFIIIRCNLFGDEQIHLSIKKNGDLVI